MKALIIAVFLTLSFVFAEQINAQGFPPSKFPSEIRVSTAKGVANYWNVNRVLCLGKASRSDSSGYKFKIVGKAMRTSSSRSIDIYYVLHQGDTAQSAGSFIFPAIEEGKPFNFDIVAAHPGYSPAKFDGFYIEDKTLPDEVKEFSPNDLIPEIIEDESPIEEKEVKPAVDDNAVYTVPETEPEFPGGLAAIYSHIAKTMRYPLIAQENGVQGKVIVGFIIEKDGSISDLKVIQSVSSDLDKEAMRVIGTLPRFTPGKVNGVPVRTQMSLPITLRLN